MRSGGASARPRPLGRLSSDSDTMSTSGSLLPSSTRASPSSTARRPRSLAGLLRRVICSCGALYILALWYSGVWSSVPTPTARSHVGIATASQGPIARDSAPSPSPLLQALKVKLEEEEELPEAAQVESDDRKERGLKKRTIAPERTEETTAPATAAKAKRASRSSAPAPLATEETAVEDVDQDEFMEEMKQHLEALDKRAAAAATTSATATVDTAETDPKADVAPAPTRSLSPKEVFHARLQNGEALSARAAVALQSLEQAAREAKKREEQLNGAEDAEAQRVADAHAKSVRPMPRGETKRRRLKCIGWRATDGCDPSGKRVPSGDRSCTRVIDPTHSGYCEVEDRDSGERFRVMRRACDSLHAQSRFRCFEAWDFSNFAVLGDNVVRDVRALEAEAAVSETTTPPVNGILIVIYPKLVPSAFAIVRSLRAMNCSLPIEFWYRTDELQVADHPALQLLARAYGPVAFRTIEDQRAVGFATKISAIQHSRFDNVLFLDADNFPVRDPTYLFDLPEFTRASAVFWPDFWHPDRTIFNIHARSLLWELVAMDFVDMFEQESGQLLINRRKSAAALALMQFYSFHRPNHFDKFRLAHGDKDLFRLAWLKTNTSFHFVQHPPGVAGKYQNDMFCGMTMVQSDPNGDVLFLHRNAKKLEGRKYKADDALVSPHGGSPHLVRQGSRRARVPAEDPAVWTHMLLLKPSVPRREYTIEIYEGAPAYPVGQWCYGKKSLSTPHFNAFEFVKLPFATLETHIRAYAVEATDLVHAAMLRTAGGGAIVPPVVYE